MRAVCWLTLYKTITLIIQCAMASRRTVFIEPFFKLPPNTIPFVHPVYMYTL
jgi:hypothetical protein